MKLNEFFSVLLEYNRDVTAAKLGPAVLAAFKKEGGQRYVGNITDEDFIINFILENLESADPTKNKQYSQWIVQTYSRGGYTLQNIINDLPAAIEYYNEIKNRNKIQDARAKNIYNFKTFDEFLKFVKSSQEELGKPIAGKYKIFYKSSDMIVYLPLDLKASCSLGSEVWCTTKPDHWEAYTKEDPLYIIVPTQPQEPGEKYQLHFKSREFMDEQNYAVGLSRLSSRFPSFKKAFAKQIEQYHLIEAKYSREQIDQAYTKFRPRFRAEIFNAIKENADAIVADFNKNADEAGIKTNKGLVAVLLNNELLDPSKLVNEIIRRSRTFNWDMLDLSKFSVIEESIRDWILETAIYDDVLSRFKNEVGGYNAPDLEVSHDRINKAVLDTLLDHLVKIFNEKYSYSLEQEIKNAAA